VFFFFFFFLYVIYFGLVFFFDGLTLHGNVIKSGFWAVSYVQNSNFEHACGC
jgi:hypothetical protein